MSVSKYIRLLLTFWLFRPLAFSLRNCIFSIFKSIAPHSNHILHQILCFKAIRTLLFAMVFSKQNFTSLFTTNNQQTKFFWFWREIAFTTCCDMCHLHKCKEATKRKLFSPSLPFGESSSCMLLILFAQSRQFSENSFTYSKKNCKCIKCFCLIYYGLVS